MGDLSVGGLHHEGTREDCANCNEGTMNEFEEAVALGRERRIRLLESHVAACEALIDELDRLGGVSWDETRKKYLATRAALRGEG